MIGGNEGGLIADRVNKRNVMVILDFSTAGLILLFMLLMNCVNLMFVVTLTLMILYGIAGAYQPTVQASVSTLVEKEHFMQANAVINIISSVSSLFGPVLSGILYSAYGLFPVLVVCTVSFVLSAVMELFIRIPYQRQERNGSILQIVRRDMEGSIRSLWLSHGTCASLVGFEHDNLLDNYSVLFCNHVDFDCF